MSAELRGITPCALASTAWAQASLGLVNVEAKPPETTAPPPPYSIQRDPGSTATEESPGGQPGTAVAAWLSIMARGHKRRRCLPTMRNAEVATHNIEPSKGALGNDLPYHLHQYRSWWPSCLKCPGPIPPVTASERGQRCITSHTRKGILPIRRKHPVPHLHLQATYLTLRSISTRPSPSQSLRQAQF